jgi:hypothetical protein
VTQISGQLTTEQQKAFDFSERVTTQIQKCSKAEARALKLDTENAALQRQITEQRGTLEKFRSLVSLQQSNTVDVGSWALDPNTPYTLHELRTRYKALAETFSRAQEVPSSFIL